MTSLPAFVHFLACIVVAYLLGSLPFAVIVSKLLGLPDPRGYGSGNPGATNVLRSGSKPAAALTLLGDAGKGWVAVWLAQQWGIAVGLNLAPLAAVAVFLGHAYPIFLRFQGGKGVATALGVLLALQPWLGVATFVVWLVVAIFSRYSSLAALSAAVFAPLFYIFASPAVWHADTGSALAILFLAAFLIYRHWGNVGRLLSGTEPRIGGKKKTPAR